MDDLLRDVRGYLDHLPECYVTYGGKCDCGLDGLTARIQQHLDTGGWIPVAEQRPDTQRNVEVTDGERRCYGNCCKGHLWNYDDPEMQLATHWRELPAPPKEK